MRQSAFLKKKEPKKPHKNKQKTDWDAEARKLVYRQLGSSRGGR